MLWIQIPNTLNLDPDPEFWPNLDPYPGLCYKFEEKNKEKIIWGNFFFSKNLFKIVKIMAPEEFLVC